MTEQHIINRIAYLKRFLDSKPEESIYTGESEYAEDAVRSENTHNDILEEEVIDEIRRLEGI